MSPYICWKSSPHALHLDPCFAIHASRAARLRSYLLTSTVRVDPSGYVPGASSSNGVDGMAAVHSCLIAGISAGLIRAPELRIPRHAVLGAALSRVTTSIRSDSGNSRSQVMSIRFVVLEESFGSVPRQGADFTVACPRMPRRVGSMPPCKNNHASTPWPIPVVRLPIDQSTSCGPLSRTCAAYVS